MMPAFLALVDAPVPGQTGGRVLVPSFPTRRRTHTIHVLLLDFLRRASGMAARLVRI